MKLKVGYRLKCVDARDMESFLTHGNIYHDFDISDAPLDSILVKDDYNIVRYFREDRFKILSNEEYCISIGII